jgi:NitT/TauT family transport system substrate-binding protein
METTANIGMVEQGAADMSSPAPSVLATAVERGSPVVGVWQMGAVDLYGFAFRAGTKPLNPRELAGRRVVLGSLAWQPIVELELGQLGIDPTRMTFVEAGAGWAQALQRGEGDLALVWEGLRAQWQAQRYDFDYLLPYEFSRLPGNSFIMRRSDLDMRRRRSIYEAYLRGWAMGLAFGDHNPRAATQIVAEAMPVIGQELTPAVLVTSVLQLARTYRGPFAQREGWGWQDPAQWQYFLDLSLRLGKLVRPLRAETFIRNDLVLAANSFDIARVQADAQAFHLAPEYEAVGIGQAGP